MNPSITKRNATRICLGLTLLVSTLLAPPASAQLDPVEIAKLLASDGVAEDWYGYSVSISGDTAIVGVPNDDDRGLDAGSAYIYEKVDGVWMQTAKLHAADGVANDQFGVSVSISNGTAIVGVPNWNEHRGSAYVYEKVGNLWLQTARFLPDEPSRLDEFGTSVSISGDTAIVGALRDDAFAGSAYLFEKVGNVWSKTARLLASDRATEDSFGRSVSISGDIAIVGANKDNDLGKWSGSAYVFEEVDGAWTQTAKLLAFDGAREDFFGASVSISGDNAIVGAPGLARSAYVFEKVDGVWTPTAKLFVSGVQIGSSVSISGDTAIVGAPNDDDRGTVSGSAYVFEKVASVWTQAAKILASDGAADDRFGWSVSISGDTVIAGAILDDDLGLNSGSAYVYELKTCLNLTVDNFVAGQPAAFTISRGTPGAKCVTLYGTEEGRTIVVNYARFCATFGMYTGERKAIGGFRRTFDADGEITFELNVPSHLTGQRFYFQSAQQDTCPGECMSNLVDAIVQ